MSAVIPVNDELTKASQQLKELSHSTNSAILRQEQETEQVLEAVHELVATAHEISTSCSDLDPDSMSIEDLVNLACLIQAMNLLDQA